MIRKSATLILSTSMLLFASEDYELDREIRNLEKELKKLDTEISDVKKTIPKDANDFQEYLVAFTERYKGVKAENDSIMAQIVTHRSTGATLSAEIQGLSRKSKNYDVQQEKLRKKLISLIEGSLAKLSETTGSIKTKQHSSFDFLKSELISKSVDNIEAMHRLINIYNDYDNQLMEIEIAQITSPVSDIRGQVYKLRIGGIFEAVVDLKGEKYAVWSGKDKTDWIFSNDKKKAAKVLEAVQVREGKALPAFVTLPLAEKGEGQ